MPSAIVAYTGPTNHRRLSEAFELDRRFWTPRGPDKARALERWQEAAEVSPPSPFPLSSGDQAG